MWQVNSGQQIKLIHNIPPFCTIGTLQKKTTKTQTNCLGVITIFVFYRWAPWWPSRSSNWAEICSAGLPYLGTCMQQVSGLQLKQIQNVPQFCKIGTFYATDLDSCKNYVKSKTRGILCVSSLNVPIVKIFSKSDQRFRSHHTFCVFTLGPLVAKPVIKTSQNLVYRFTLPRGIYVASFRSIDQGDAKRATILDNRHFLRNLTQITGKSRSNPKPGGYYVYPY